MIRGTECEGLPEDQVWQISQDQKRLFISIELKLLIIIRGSMEKFNQMSHPGIILKREFMNPYGITADRLAKDAKIDNMTVSEIIRGKRAITTKIALKLAKYFRASESYFINLQKEYDIRFVKNQIAEELESIQTLRSA